MAKEKVIHARIDDDLHDGILEKCNELGCSLSDYFVSVLDSNVNDEPKEIEPKRTEPIIGLKLDKGKIYDPDGNYIGLLQGFEPKPEITVVDLD